MRKKDIIEKYRNQVENRCITPPETCWDEINTGLDIEDTWSSISAELSKVLPYNDVSVELQVRNQLSFSRIISVVSPLTLIFLMFLFSDNRNLNIIPSEMLDINASSVITEQSDESHKNQATQINQARAVIKQDLNIKITPVLTPPQKKTGVNSSEPSELQFREVIAVVDSAENIYSDNFVPSVIKSIDEKSGAINSGVGKLLVPDTFPFEKLLISSGSPSQNILPQSKPENTDEENRSSSWDGSSFGGRNIILNKFSVGISLTEKNAWMLSQETFDGLNRQTLNTSQVKFLSDFGFIVRFSPNENWSFEGNGFFLSRSGQTYKQYKYGIYGTKAYDLRYVSFELSARYSMPKSLNTPNIKFYPVAGAYISHLNAAYKIINQQKYDVSYEYIPIDYGLIAGYEVEFLILNRIALTPGFRIKFGLPNIFTDQPGLPKELHAARNASLELRLNMTFPLVFF